VGITVQVHRIISYSCCTFLSLLLDSNVQEFNLGKPAFAVIVASHLLLKDIKDSTSNLRLFCELSNPKHFLISAEVFFAHSFHHWLLFSNYSKQLNEKLRI